jgi:hypothetical protein
LISLSGRMSQRYRGPGRASTRDRQGRIDG